VSYSIGKPDAQKEEEEADFEIDQWLL
jgi:hypothetical protein